MSYNDGFQRRSIGRRGEDKKTPFFSSILVFLGVSFLFGIYIIYSTGSLELVPKVYTIDKGATIKSIPSVLHLDISSIRYNLWVRFFAPKDTTLKVGAYEVSRGITLSEFFTETLAKPKYTDITITVLPGWNLYDIDAYLVSKKITNQAGDFLTEMEINKSFYEEKYPFLKGKESFEGFLYPDTYRLKLDATARDVLIKLLSEFDEKIGKEYTTLGSTAYKKLILASIVEREERKKSEQPIVAGILEKRVREGIPMGADATVCTGYGKTWKQCTPEFIASVIRDKHPFNTRAKQGYPPTPISAITQDVWNATIHSKESPYYYYLHDSDGTIHYAKTLEEHAINKEKYLK